MKQLHPSSPAGQIAPVRILQFGEGNFLRAFVDYMVDAANGQGVLNASVAVVKPIEFGDLSRFKEQGNLFTLVVSGIQNGVKLDQKQIIRSIADTVDAYADYDAFMAYAKSPDLRFVVSNTTEAGIACREDDRMADCPPASYPAKLTQFLYARYEAFGGDLEKGLYILPCELIEQNGKQLKACVYQTAQKWKLPSAFMSWLDAACAFSSTLVDRIVTGYPKAREQALWEELGYIDHLMDCCEPFALWVIEEQRIGAGTLSKELPLHRAGLPVVFAGDVLPYRNRKVRILNGAHTTTVPAAFLGGFDYVNRYMADETVRHFMQAVLQEEIIPTLTLPRAELEAFAAAVTERFSNPFIDHALLSITLNSISKWKARVLCSMKDYVKAKGALPKRIVFSFAALCAFYLGEEIRDGALIGTRRVNGVAEEYPIRDDMQVLAFFAGIGAQYQSGAIGGGDYIRAVMHNADFWGEDLSGIAGFEEAATDYFNQIEQAGAIATMQALG